MSNGDNLNHYPGYYHFQPQANFCPCCGKPLNQQYGYQWPPNYYWQGIGIAPQNQQTTADRPIGGDTPS